MNEKLKTLQNICGWAGFVSLFTYMVLTIVGSSNVFNVVSIITAAIGLIAFAIKCGVEVASEENSGMSIFFNVYLFYRYCIKWDTNNISLIFRKSKKIFFLPIVRWVFFVHKFDKNTKIC